MPDPSRSDITGAERCRIRLLAPSLLCMVIDREAAVIGGKGLVGRVTTVPWSFCPTDCRSVTSLDNVDIARALDIELVRVTP